MTRLLLLLAWCWLGWSHAAVATDPTLDLRFKRLTQTLRCVVCQNESLADSTAPLAQDLKAEIRRRMEAGASDADIQAFLVQRYGDFVSYRPPVRGSTALLWAGPVLLLLVALAVVVRQSRRVGSAPDQAAGDSV